MKVAIVGSGISGLASAWLLSRRHEVTLFEAGDHFGGHTHTHRVEVSGHEYAVDTGFIVHNRAHYPLLSALFDELGVETHATTMSFSVHNARTGLEYNASSIGGLFCQRRNLVSPRFLGMLGDLLRFYREAPYLLVTQGDGPTLNEYLQAQGYGDAFQVDHIVPMACALWSSPAKSVLDFPAKYLVRFMANHHMLQIRGRPGWRVVTGGSQRYVDAMRATWAVEERLRCPVTSVRRVEDGIDVTSAAGSEHYDAIVMACHSDDALRLLVDASADERAILGAITYQTNHTVLHTDARLMPSDRRAWAAWNAHVPADATETCSVSYCMNLLQGLDAPEPLIVTLNRTDAIGERHILRQMSYRHPVYTHASIAAQGRKRDIQGRRCTWFAGAYWGWGFHEDGMRSTSEVVTGIERAAMSQPHGVTS